LRPLGVCIPNTPTQGYKISADSSGKLFLTFYGDPACVTGATVTIQDPNQPCACSSTSCSNSGYYYGTSLPSIAATVSVSVRTEYAGASCTGTPTGYSYTIATAVCIPSACSSTTTSGLTFAYTTVCTTTQSPTPSPIVIAPVFVTAQQTLVGVSSTTFSGSVPMQTAFKSTIAKAAGIPTTAITITGASRRLRRSLLDTTVAYTVQTTSDKTDATSLAKVLQSSTTQSSLTASLVRAHNRS
jgi:hypothetical protein